MFIIKKKNLWRQVKTFMNFTEGELKNILGIY